MLAVMISQATVTAADQVHPIDFDLRSSVNLKSCASVSPVGGDGEIVVCGRRDADSRYRLTATDTSRYEPNRRAETTLAGNLKGAAEVEQRELAPGITSKRIMFRLKLPF